MAERQRQEQQGPFGQYRDAEERRAAFDAAGYLARSR
jgi:hypothetical protein